MAERAESEKLSHKEVEYERTSEHAGKSCSNCGHVIEAAAGVRCESVKPPIYLTGYCIRWSRKQKS
jgi:hypothetical protein